jgi:phosphatidylserine decarboxylase
MSNEPTPNGRSGGGFVEDLPAPAIAPEGVPIIVVFVIVSALLTLAATWFGGSIWGMATGVAVIALCAWCVWFFRDPRRRIPAAKNGEVLVISPADGVICAVGPALPPEDLGVAESERLGLTRVSVFMNVFNVHVNRAPVAGVVEKRAYRKGKFVNAALDKASADNERMALLLRMQDGSSRALVVVQIAGLIARRIVCRVKEGARLGPGERFGIIRFGSRVDVYLPRGVEPRVKVGDRSVAGETVFAVMAAGPGAGRGNAG